MSNRNLKSKTETMLLLMLRFRCLISTYENLLEDPRVQERVNLLLRRLHSHLPSQSFTATYMDKQGPLGSDAKFALRINHDMNTVVLARCTEKCCVLIGGPA